MTMTQKWTAPRIRALKGRQRIPVLTASDVTQARLMDEAGIPMILVGDSLGMTVLGYENTLPVTLEQMLIYTAAVRRGAKSAMVITDMPFLTYQASIAEAVTNAGRCLKESGADGVKIEGGELRVDTVRALVENGIPVMGHIGLLPQSVHATGGFKVQGRTPESVERLLRDARALDAAGVFCMVLEGMPAEVGQQVTAAVGVPTIGIGAGASCDGQVLVINDVLGLTPRPPKFVKQYANLLDSMTTAIVAYKKDVEAGSFPGPEHGY